MRSCSTEVLFNAISVFHRQDQMIKFSCKRKRVCECQLVSDQLRNGSFQFGLLINFFDITQ